MPGKFSLMLFSSCNLNDPFFDSLKGDYPEFSQWFTGKAISRDSAYVFRDNDNLVHAFMYLKSEEEDIQLTTGILPKISRIKIGTLKLSESIYGQRMGEGALGTALWRWQESNSNQIYLTVFPRHTTLIELITKFGFGVVGENKRGELVFLKDKQNLDLSSPFKAFPYLLPNFEKAGYLPINQDFHDTLFPYSELYNTNQEAEEIAAANGITKVFLASPLSQMHHRPGEPVIVYRKYMGTGKIYKSVATSYCTLTKVIPINLNNSHKLSRAEFLELAANKTVFSREQLQDFYLTKKNLILLEMVYNGFFGKGKNVNYKTLSESGLFQGYPYNIQLTPENLVTIFRLGGKNATNLIANKSRTH
ncbi:hypothetical protein SRRS_07550 [Sporomusa rhizae]|uniref:hypothetical protein n=1 Tax=Sporomusa rhizae TaxID=357999 RepID=UPI00352B8AAB